MKGRLLRIGMGMLIGLVLLLFYALWPQRPDVGGPAIDPDAHDVTILRDTWGVPHVYGTKDSDTAFGLAYAHAEDDFLTIQQSIVAARGDLAEHYGRQAAPNDYLVSLLRIWDVVGAGYDTLRADTRAVLEAYASGLNFYAQRHASESLPGLFPVTGRDIVATSVHKSPLFFGLDAALAELYEAESAAEVSAAGLGMKHGSNVLAVAPSRTPDGSTLFASNSHQPWTGPVTWYEAHVHSEEGWNMTGALFPGVPVMILGHNEDLAWSFTVNHGDLVDTYVLTINPDDENQYWFDGRWRDFERRDVPITVRLLGRLHWTVHEEALWSELGPVVRRPHGTYAIRYAGSGLVGIYEQLFDMNKASTFDEWRAALARQSGLATFNVGYADRAGNIFYAYHGLLPERTEGYDYSGYLPGDRVETLWDSYLPFDELPQVLNPQSGFLVNANSTPFAVTVGSDNPDPNSYAGSFGIERFTTNRSQRAIELLSGDPSITFDELRTYKMDHRYSGDSDVARFRERLLSLAPPDQADALEVLEVWDLTAGTETRGAALMVVTLTYLHESLEFEPSRLTVNEVTDEQLLEAFRAAGSWLRKHHGSVDVAWGDILRLRRGDVDAPLAGGPDLLRAVYPHRNDSDGVLEGVGGDSYVLLVEWRPDGSVYAESIHQFGSATLNDRSPHFDDQAPRFAGERLKEAWFLEEDIRAHLEREYRPGQEE